MKKIGLFFVNYCYQVYSCEQVDSYYEKKKPFDFHFVEEEQNIFESRFARLFFSLLLIFAK